jgi:hypothetical protein
MAEKIYDTSGLEYRRDFEIAEDGTYGDVPKYKAVSTDGIVSLEYIFLQPDGKYVAFPKPDFSPHTKWKKNDADGRYLS